jgi:hypothetical protein
LSSKIGFVGASALAVLAAFVMASPAAAGTDAHHAVKAHHARSVYPVHRPLRFVRRAPSGYDVGPRNAIVMPGYVFVPGAGIVGEACDLPSSACPNEYRDIS